MRADRRREVFMPHEVASHQDASADRLRLVDVGGAGGLQDKLVPHTDRIFPILFEPNSGEASELRDQMKGNGLVVETALSNEACTRKLNIARFWGCASLLPPNPDVLSRYRIN